MVNVIVNGKQVDVPPAITLLEAIRMAGTSVPTLCTLQGLTSIGVCRMCVVEVERARALVPSCSTPVSEGMVISTESARVQNARRTVLDLIASEHEFDCKNCPRNSNCEIQRLAFELDLDYLLVDHHVRDLEPDLTNRAVMLDFDRCILCGRCIRSCSEIQTVYAIDYAFRGYNTIVSSPLGEGLGTSSCVSCGLCTLNCPVAAIQERPSFPDIEADIKSGVEASSVVDPFAMVTMSEEFQIAPGKGWTKGIDVFLKEVGFKSALISYDGFDLTIIEEANELLASLDSKRGAVISSSCPASVDFIEKFFPSRRIHLSKARSPQLAIGSLMRSGLFERTYLASKEAKIASVTYCLGKKSEIHWPPNLGKIIGSVVSVRELANVLRLKGPGRLENVNVSEFQASPSILDVVSGGRAELVLRTAARISGEVISEDSLNPLRAEGEYKSTVISLGSSEVNVIAANTLRSCRKALENMDGSQLSYVELRACPDGCVGGGGQPIPSSEEVRRMRTELARSLYEKSNRATPWDSIWSRTLYRKASEAGLIGMEGRTIQ